MKDVRKLVRPNILALAPYSTARDDFKGGDISVWLDANESPFNHHVSSDAYDVDINRYPDPHQKALKEAVSRLKGVPVENIFLGGAGSDEAIDLVYRIFCEPAHDNVVSIAPSYGVYSVAAAINNVEFREVQLNEDFSLPVDRLLSACDDRTKAIWICSPNNPTANAFSIGDIMTLLEKFDGMVVVDEAYIDFSTKGSMLPLIEKYPNLIVLQTFSKAWGMASLRLGMAFSTVDIARLFAMVKYPYNINGPTQVEVMRQISRDITGEIRLIVNERTRLERELSGISSVKAVFPSDANFILVRFDDPDRVYDYLVENGVIVRNRSRLKGCEGTLRITVGTPEENNKLISLLSVYGDKA